MMRTRTRPERVAGRARRRLQKVRSKLEIVLECNPLKATDQGDGLEEKGRLFREDQDQFFDFLYP